MPARARREASIKRGNRGAESKEQIRPAGAKGLPTARPMAHRSASRRRGAMGTPFSNHRSRSVDQSGTPPPRGPAGDTEGRYSLPPAMMPMPEGAAREEKVRSPASVSVSVRPIIVDVGCVDARGIRIGRRLHVDAPLGIDGCWCIVVTLDYPLALHDAWGCRALDDGVTL